jgi:two-component system, NarL family, nitrate/nitrite response regulator NarL
VVTVFILVQVRLYREGLEQHLGRYHSIEVVGSARSSADALASLRRLRPEILLLDLGLEASLNFAPVVRGALPETRLIVLGISGASPDVIACAEAGVRGYVTREATLADLVETIERTARGEAVCPPAVTASLLERIAVLANARRDRPHVVDQLTNREVEIVRLIEQGMSNKEIASALCIAVPTVKNHVHNVLSKLNLQRRRDLTGYWS